MISDPEVSSSFDTAQAISKHEGLLEEWDRAIRGDAGRKGAFSFKQSGKTPSAKHVEELKARLDIAQQERASRTAHAERARDVLQKSLRPRHIAAWRELIAAADAATAAQLSRYGTLTWTPQSMRIC